MTKYEQSAKSFRAAVGTFIAASVLSGGAWWMSLINVSDTMTLVIILMCLVVLVLIAASISCAVNTVTSYMAAKDDERDAVLEMLNQIRWDIEKDK